MKETEYMYIVHVFFTVILIPRKKKLELLQWKPLYWRYMTVSEFDKYLFKIISNNNKKKNMAYVEYFPSFVIPANSSSLQRMPGWKRNRRSLYNASSFFAIVNFHYVISFPCNDCTDTRMKASTSPRTYLNLLKL